MKVQKVNDSDMLDVLKSVLDLGESEAIALALELALPLIIDEKKGRKIALREGIKIIGLLGIVYLNIKKETISEKEAKEFLDNAVDNGYRISIHLIDEMFASL
jgi:predicted nucleic acid-binding protein